ncbi:MAG: hypothetical protein H6R31_369, partial [Methanomicrobia archaeon]|nr:hypothetical protein [Methanomicrobia archaeon]
SIQRLIEIVTRTDAIRAYKERDKKEPERSTEHAAKSAYQCIKLKNI